LRVYWKGPFYTSTSLAIVNRRLVSALLKRGNLDIAISTDPLAPNSLSPEFRALAEHTHFGAAEADVTILHEFPPRFAAPAESRYVHVQPWEFGSMPQAWYDALHDDCDEIWVHSTYNRDAYVEAGIAPDRVGIVPHGVDPNVFTPDGPKAALGDERFRFLFVGATIPRKGIDLLVNAYLAEFTPRDRVALTIKDASTNEYRGLTRSVDIQALAARPDLARIEYIDQTVPDEAMAQIYRAADCFVLPYRGEGFGMPILEAMASGLPSIVTDGGASDDFVDAQVGWRIPSARVDVDPAIIPFPTVTPPWIREPDKVALQQLLREAFESHEEVRRRGAAAARRARADWTWDHAAARVERRLETLSQRDPVLARARQDRYRDSALYAEQAFGTTALDGIVVELFRRIGAGSAFFVEVTRGGFSVAPALARGLSWKGILLGETDAEALAGPPDEIDLLSLACSNAESVTRRLASYRPRVIVSATPIDLAGYARIDVALPVSLFVRSDLAARAGFTLREPARS